MRWMAGCMIILIIAGCTNHTKVPSGIIKQQRMEKILWDMLQAAKEVKEMKAGYDLAGFLGNRMLLRATERSVAVRHATAPSRGAPAGYIRLRSCRSFALARRS